MDLTLITCDHNTPELAANLLRSVRWHCASLPEVIVVNTSDAENPDYLVENMIPYINFCHCPHGPAVNEGLARVRTRYALLVDSDVILLRDPGAAFEYFKYSGATLMGKRVGDWAGKKLYPRIAPWFCFMDVRELRFKNIEFFDCDRSVKDGGQDRNYDVGSTMFEDVSNAGLLIENIELEGEIFKHYGGMSWHIQHYDAGQPDTDVDFGGSHPHAWLYENGLKVRRDYDLETLHLKGISIFGIFSAEKTHGK